MNSCRSPRRPSDFAVWIIYYMVTSPPYYTPGRNHEEERSTSLSLWTHTQGQRKERSGHWNLVTEVVKETHILPRLLWRFVPIPDLRHRSVDRISSPKYLWGQDRGNRREVVPSSPPQHPSLSRIGPRTSNQNREELSRDRTKSRNINIHPYKTTKRQRRSLSLSRLSKFSSVFSDFNLYSWKPVDLTTPVIVR